MVLGVNAVDETGIEARGQGVNSQGVVLRISYQVECNKYCGFQKFSYIYNKGEKASLPATWGRILFEHCILHIQVIYAKENT